MPIERKSYILRTDAVQAEENKRAIKQEEPGYRFPHVDTIFARSNLSEVISRAQYGGEPLVLTRRRKPIAVLISTDEFDKLLKLKEAEEAKNVRTEVKDVDGQSEYWRNLTPRR